MKSIGVAGSAFIILVFCATAAAAAGINPPAGCSVPADQLLRRFELDVPGATRVTRTVNIPAGTEVLVEAFETNVNTRLEVREADGQLATAENALHRWPPHRLVIANGPARRVEISIAGVDRAHGSAAVQLSRLASRNNQRCADFWRAMASGDAAYSRGAMIFRGETDAATGASQQAYEEALAAYTRAGTLGSDGFDAAQTQLVRASVLMNALERFPEALEAASAAEAGFKVLGLDYGRDLARFYWAYSLTYDAMASKDPAAAKSKFETARNEFLDVAASHLKRGELREHAEALDGAACTNGFLFQYADTIAGYQRALEIFEQLHEPDRAVAMRLNLAFFESAFGRYQEALKHQLEILAENGNIKDPDAYLTNLRNAAFIELKLGKYDDALRHYSDAYERSLRTQAFRGQALALYGLGNTYYAIGNFGEALNYLERSLELRPEQQRARDRSNALRTLANALGEAGRGREAIARREEALRITRIPMEKAHTTLELVNDHIDVGDLAIAKSLIAPLLATRDLPDPAIDIGATFARARVALAEGDAASAMRDARTAADFYRAHELVSSEFAALLVEARAACLAHARDQALEVAQSAVQHAEEIRTFSSNPTLRASLWQPLRPAFGFTIGLLARANSCGGTAPADPLGALAIAEASRGRALEDFRRRSSTDANQSKMSDRRHELFEQLAGVRQQLETVSSTGSADDERLKILRAEAARLRREIDLTGGLPESNRRRPEDLRPELRARVDAIPKDTAVVEYWIGKDEAFAWLLTRGRVQLVDLGPADRIDAAARSMNGAMRNWLSGDAGSRIARAQELHALIIAPLPAELASARTVYFIPDGALHVVPFAALAEGGRVHPRFFVESHDVAVAPAFLAIAPDSERREVARNSTALVVVDPVYASDDRRFTRAVEVGPAPQATVPTLRGSQSWVRLPATAGEAATISRLLEPGAVQVLSGFDASRDTLLGSDLAKYNILHFATHAVADTEAPQLSALILSTIDAQGKSRVGEVFAGDLADQRMDAALVVFSGCETALGRAAAGEGLLGLRYAAHAAGARAVVASLWPVEDAAGARLMEEMYAEVISRKATPVSALSHAMRSSRVRSGDPALWAAFDVSIEGF